MTGIPGLGGHNAQLQRALMELAERALEAEDAEMTLVAPRDRTSGPAKGASTSVGSRAPDGEAVILELSSGMAELLVEKAPDPAEGSPGHAEGSPGRAEGSPSRAEMRTAAPRTSDNLTPRRDNVTPQRLKELPLDQLVAVLKRSGTDFKHAARILANIELERPLPPKAVLKAMWNDAPTTESKPTAEHPEHPERMPEPARARTPEADSTDTTDAARHPGLPPRRAEADAVYSAPLDRLVRDRSWHRANPEPADRPAEPAPTLRTVVEEQRTNQVYVAGLTTAEYQRLATLLGRDVPGWFAEVRGSRGLRAILERGAVAHLSVTRLAGMRLGGWGLGAAGIAIAWVVGVRTGSWW